MRDSINDSTNKTNEEVINKDKKAQQTVFIGEEFVLPFRPFELNNEYSVLCTIEKGEHVETLKQNYKVRRLRPDTDQNDYHFIQIDKISELLIDGKPADLAVHKVAEKTAQFLFPIRIVVDKYGKWVDLNSYDKLKERWEKQKDEIEDAYEGEVYDTIVDNIEKAIIDDDTLIESLSGNWFLRAFFNGIHIAYTEKLKIEKNIFFPAIAEMDDLEFLLSQKAEPYLNDLNLIEVTQEGELENEYLEGFFNARYFLNPNHYNIESLELECNLIEIKEKISIKVDNLNESKIDFHSISLLV